MPLVATPPWTADGPDAPDLPAVTEDLDCDVVVVGGGIAGLAAAWYAAREGLDVVLLEAGRVGGGVTGHTTAKVSVLQGLAYRTIARRHGPWVARQYAEAQLAGLDALRKVVAGEGFECELEEQPSYTYARPGRSRSVLESEAKAALRAGIDAELVGDVPLPFDTVGAVRVDGQAQVNPGPLMRGWCQAARDHGVRVFEHTRVTALRHRGELAVVTGNGHTVRAQDVVVATHYPVFDRALLFPRIKVSREFAVAAPMAEPPPGMFYGVGEDAPSIRPWRDQVVVSGRMFRPGSGAQERALAALERDAHDLLPGLGPVRSRWAAQDVTGHDQLPYVGRMLATTAHVHVATGFRGWGMTNGVAAGLAIAGRIAGDAPAWSRVLEPARTMLPAGLPRFVHEQVTVGKELALGFAPGHARGDLAPADLDRGQGAVLRVDGHERAVCRDDDGVVHEVGARCTHLGCLVSFNAPEQTWECGCHGSRFAPHGTVLSGPATRPLAGGADRR